MSDVKKNQYVWTKSLKSLPLLTDGIVETFIDRTSCASVTATRAYKFFMESYIHDYEGT